MAVVGARACLELPPTTRSWFLSATRRYTARAGRMSRGDGVSACWDRTRLGPTEEPSA